VEELKANDQNGGLMIKMCWCVAQKKQKHSTSWLTVFREFSLSHFIVLFRV
jgi:hypothetical protein